MRADILARRQGRICYSDISHRLGLEEEEKPYLAHYRYVLNTMKGCRSSLQNRTQRTLPLFCNSRYAAGYTGYATWCSIGMFFMTSFILFALFLVVSWVNVQLSNIFVVRSIYTSRLSAYALVVFI